MSAHDPAFPVIKTELFYDRDAGQYYPHVSSEGGLTKRELFAGMALQGYTSGGYPSTYTSDEIARMSVAKADALIAELERTA